MKNWKKRLREALFNKLPPAIYLKVVPAYFKLFNPKRRGCRYTFSRDKKGRNIINAGNHHFYFVDHRRISRYVWPDGLHKIQQSMLSKYTTQECDLSDGDIVVEIGGNIGEFTLPAANKSKKIYVFEPDPNCIACLNENVKQLNNVEIIKMGASNENGEKTFYLSSEDADSSFITPTSYTEEIKIQSVRLDTWMDNKKLSKVDFLKLEAEGGELEVLEGLGKKIHQVNKISVDAGPERYGKPTFREVNKYLLDNGFTTRIERFQVFAWKKM